MNTEAHVKDGLHWLSCFKAQQVAEFSLRSILRALGRPAFGHNLVAFLNELAGICPGLTTELRFCVGYLDKMYVSGFNYGDIEKAPPHRLVKEYGVTHEKLWNNLREFLEYIVPIAEQSNVKIAMHPDDPPIPEFRGIPRIMNSIESFEKLLILVRSDYNGITLCQGNFTLMTDDLPSVIKRFRDRIFFVHFRDVKGDRYNFVETLIGEGKTDLVGVMRAYVEIGYNGYVRVDHTPTLENDAELGAPGYNYLGRIYTIGYIKGLYEAVKREFSKEILNA
ncbi:mannonate dehydratase [Caldivirga maquilingensis]|uniref:mannonate dehydratase n=1 Tax=Caldivirga maquilingensis (strain ATCC 700844 / DSM 13496 / JCM 10307 / IC-167) TaxID=397948 RepID=A8MB10_CALMQ|nr:mannonate dehydratase [Caldivirga maquilingensis]ABW02639.1 Mannonate dehydratase [Caldivirga maquilingensis IC-167]